MGRKIPAKKHRGVKDPLAQQAKRLESLKGKINAPPKDPDDQPMPRSLMTLFGLQDPNKKDSTKKKKLNKPRNLLQKKGDNLKNRGSSDNPVSRLRKLPGESGRGFSLRINSAIKALHSPDEELDYPQHDMEAEDYKGQQMAEQRERRAKKRRRAEKVAKKNGEEGDGETEQHLTRTQKLALKKKARKLKALEVSKEKAEVVYERVSFGDVTHAPPTLHFKSKKNVGAPRPGRRDLLLTKLLPGGDRPAARSVTVPPAELQRRERARLDAVAAYRALKAAKYKQK